MICIVAISFTNSVDQANKLLNENRNITAYAKCIAAGHDWDTGQCMSGKIVAITGPTVCHHTSEGQTCESGSVAGSGWIPVKYINHTAPDPGCTRLTDHPNYESCVDVTNTNATEPIKWTNFTNATWTIYNSTSGSSSTITFKTIPHDYKDGDFTFGMNVTTFVRTLNGHTYKGILGDDNGLIGSTDTTFMLCSNQWRIESSGLMHLGVSYLEYSNNNA